MKKCLYGAIILQLVSCTLYTTLFTRTQEHNEIIASQSIQQQGRVIFITGSCSAGKSSLARIIAQELNAKFFAFDEQVMPLVFKRMIKKQLSGVAAFFLTTLLMHNFYTVISLLSEKRKRAIQEKFYAELEHGIVLEPTNRMYKKARQIALSGQDVVIESPLYLGGTVDTFSSLSVLADLKVLVVLAYCPWQKLVERIEQRNKSSNKTNHRELDWALANFVHCFDVSINPGERAIDKLDGHVVADMVTVHRKPGYKKKRLYIIDETEHATLHLFKTNSMNYIYPRFSYDLMVNTGIHDPQQGAACVLDLINNIDVKKFQQIQKLSLVQRPTNLGKFF